MLCTSVCFLGPTTPTYSNDKIWSAIVSSSLCSGVITALFYYHPATFFSCFSVFQYLQLPGWPHLGHTHMVQSTNSFSQFE